MTLLRIILFYQGSKTGLDELIGCFRRDLFDVAIFEMLLLFPVLRILYQHLHPFGWSMLTVSSRRDHGYRAHRYIMARLRFVTADHHNRIDRGFGLADLFFFQLTDRFIFFDCSFLQVFRFFYHDKKFNRYEILYGDSRFDGGEIRSAYDGYFPYGGDVVIVELLHHR